MFEAILEFSSLFITGGSYRTLSKQFKDSETSSTEIPTSSKGTVSRSFDHHLLRNGWEKVSHKKMDIWSVVESNTVRGKTFLVPFAQRDRPPAATVGGTRLADRWRPKGASSGASQSQRNDHAPAVCAVRTRQAEDLHPAAQVCRRLRISMPTRR